MTFKLGGIEVQSRRDMQMIDVTDQVEKVVSDSGVSDGLVLVLTTHTSSGLLVTEGIDCL